MKSYFPFPYIASYRLTAIDNLQLI